MHLWQTNGPSLASSVAGAKRANHSDPYFNVRDILAMKANRFIGDRPIAIRWRIYERSISVWRKPIAVVGHLLRTCAKHLLKGRNF